MGSLGSAETPNKKAMWLYPKVLGFNPSERWGHSACYAHGVVYVFGGCCGGINFSDVLMLNLDSMVWSTMETIGQGPGPRDSHSAVLVGRQMIVFGGTNGCKKVNDLHILDLETKEWTRPECTGTPPSPRESHTATLIADDRIVIFGGSGEGSANYLNDLHVLDLKDMRWSTPEVKGDIPVPRDSHSAVATGNKLVVYGGDRGDRYHGEVDVLDVDTLTWTKLLVQGASPGVRAGHAAVNIGTKVYVIGGVGDKYYYNDVWVLDLGTCSWILLDICSQKPQGRFSHTAVVTESDIVIYGGCGEDEHPLNELLILQLGPEHLSGSYNISMCKIFGKDWSQEKRRFPRLTENGSQGNMFMNDERVQKGVRDPKFESNQPFQFASDVPHPKRKRTMNSKTWDVEPEQEEHSLSLSQHSSPSQSDQEQTPGRRTADSLESSRGFNLFKQVNGIPRNCQPNDIATNQNKSRNFIRRTPYNLQMLKEQQKRQQYVQVVHTGRQGTAFPAVEQKPLEAGSIQNMIGADVRGKVDGVFDSGLLMTANVNGKIFRGVLFAPAPCFAPRVPNPVQNPSSPTAQIVVAQPCPNLNHMTSLKPLQQPMAIGVQESSQAVCKAPAVSRAYPAMRAAPSLTKEPKLRSDLQGVVLTLGGPGTGHVGNL